MKTAAARIAAEAPPRADLLEVFAIRCWARARLFAAGEIDLHIAVDELQIAAEESGLVAAIGQDEVQRIIADAFHKVRENPP